MKNRFHGMGKVFRFTLNHQIGGKNWRTVTVCLALLFFLLPVVIMGLTEAASSSPSGEWTPQVRTVYTSADPDTDYSLFSLMGGKDLQNVEFIPCGGEEEAVHRASQDPQSLLLFAETRQDGTLLRVLLPDNTDLQTEETEWMAQRLEQIYPMLLMQHSGLTPQQLEQLSSGIQMETHTGGLVDNDPVDIVHMVFSMVLPYLVIMLLYFMMLAYGQSVAGCVIMEKSSKLMDTFLLALHPSALIMGKLLATVTAALLQLSLWIASLVGGFAAGTAVVRAINPASDMALLRFFDFIGKSSSLFSLPGILMALAVVAAGFLLYCSLASVGGALASKAEDLGNTNILFTLALVASFLAVIYGGGTDGSLPASSWMLYMPFSAVMVAPGMLLMGDMSPVQGGVSLLIILATALLVVLLAGALYRATVFHRGDPITPDKAIRMLRGRRS